MHTYNGSKMRNKSMPSQFRSSGLGGNSKLMRMIAKNKEGSNTMVFSTNPLGSPDRADLNAVLKQRVSLIQSQYNTLLRDV